MVDAEFSKPGMARHLDVLRIFRLQLVKGRGHRNRRGQSNCASEFFPITHPSEDEEPRHECRSVVLQAAVVWENDAWFVRFSATSERCPVGRRKAEKKW
jgi:hypothetical protein